jgi:hypothetical protein
MNHLKPKIELLTNVAIIVVAIAICAVLAKQYVFTSSASLAGPAIGSKLELPGADLSSSDRTLLLVLQKGCHYCTESGPFYQRLVREAAKSGHVKLVAVLPQDPDVGRQYLSGLGLSMAEVTQASLDSLGVGGTPTLIMLKGDAVSDVWVGKLAADEEDKVLGKL